jgi:hypothetical protein
MSAENPFENDFFFPRVQKKHALREQNQAHKRFRMMISKEEQRAFGDLLQRTNKRSPISYLPPRQTLFEYLRLVKTIEVHKEIETLRVEVRWKWRA